MKRCPQCGAEYDDHVEFCFVDGSELASAGSGPMAAPTGVPAPSATPPATTSRAGAGTAFVVVFVLFLGAVVLIGGVGAAVMFLMPGEPEVAAQPDPAPEPPPKPPPEPPPPQPPAIAKVGFTSTPDDAQLWEGQTMLCTTPCTVDHPDHAPVPRQFVLKRDGYVDTPHEMTDPSKPQHVDLKAVRRVRPTRPAPPKPDIIFER